MALLSRLDPPMMERYGSFKQICALSFQCITQLSTLASQSARNFFLENSQYKVDLDTDSYIFSLVFVHEAYPFNYSVTLIVKKYE